MPLRLVAAFTGLIERDYRKGNGVSDYATALGVTATHLTRCCNQTCGKSALALLRDRVNYEACVLLRETQTPVNKITTQLARLPVRPILHGVFRHKQAPLREFFASALLQCSKVGSDS